MPNRIAALLLFAATAASAQTLDQRIERELPQFVATYKQLHAAPELSMKEAKTSVFLASQLRALGYEVTERVGKYNDPAETAYGVVAILKNGAGPTVLFRSDMDALPVTEATGLPYASTVRTKNATGEEVGVMHACGHDVHMTTLIGTAKMLASMKEQWHGTVMFIGQPAEEIVAGAAAMLRDGLYERFGKPDYVIALHDSAAVAAGKAAYTPGYTMASSDSVDVTIRGIGGHGAAPQLGKDPVVIAAEFVLGLQTIVSRERSPLDPVVVTVGSIHGGTKRNIIPDEVKLYLTIRAYKPEVRDRVIAAIERVARGVAMTAGVPDDRMPIVTVNEAERIGATFNDPALTERLAAALKKSMGEPQVLRIDPLMVAEDFGRFSLDNKIPAALLQFGATDPAVLVSNPTPPGLHSSKFAPLPEPALRTGIKTATTMLLELLQ